MSRAFEFSSTILNYISEQIPFYFDEFLGFISRIVVYSDIFE